MDIVKAEAYGYDFNGRGWTTDEHAWYWARNTPFLAGMKNGDFRHFTSKQWHEKSTAYYADDLGAPSGRRNDVARTHEEYDATEARKACLWEDREYGPSRNRNHDGPRFSHTNILCLFPEGRRANVPADKDKRVRLAYLMDFFAAELAEPDECWNKEHWDSLRPLEEEMEMLRKEVSPWGGEVAT